MKSSILTPAQKYKLKHSVPEIYKKADMTLINNHFENNRQYNIPRAQLIIADIPFNLGNNAYASNPMWYKDGDNKKGESELAGKNFFNTDEDFRVSNLFHFCSRLLRPEPKEKNEAPCMIVFCAFQQMFDIINCAKEYGFAKYIPLQWYKNYSPQVLKANMKVVGNTEYALLFYKDKLPKFRNNGSMIFNNRPWVDDNSSESRHPTQKPLGILKQLILQHTDKGDVVIDPCCGSASTLIAASQLGRPSFGFEIDKEFVARDIKYFESTGIQKDLF